MQIAGHRLTLARGFADFVYVTGGLPVGAMWFMGLVVLLSVGAGLSLATIGIPVLAATLLVWRWGANRERERAALVLGAPIERAHRPATGPLLDRWRTRVKDPATWKDLGYLLLLGPVGFVTGLVTIMLWAVAVAGVAAPAVSVAAPAGSALADWSAPAFVASVMVGLVAAALAVLVTRVLASALAALARLLLEPDERARLAARVSALEASRSGAVESADARLRRLERDLHDGAQHRLAFVAMELDRARRKLPADPEGADALLAGAHEESKRAMRELRDLVRGIHPSVLADRGLDAALSGLAARSAVPVQLEVELAGRPPAAAETAAYYVVAEALTNVTRHAEASRATVRVRRAGERLVVEVTDDGRGGARRVPGSGLEGLAQRVDALDGTLEVTSPDGGPTTIRAELPCAL